MNDTRQEKWDVRFLSLAKFVSGWSKDPSTKVGAVIVENGNRIVSLGFNGFPQGMPDLEENLFNREEKYARVIHAETNAMLFAGARTKGATIYSTHILCERCAVLAIQAGIARVVCMRRDPNQLRWGTSTRQYFAECGITCVELDFT